MDMRKAESNVCAMPGMTRREYEARKAALWDLFKKYRDPDTTAAMRAILDRIVLLSAHSCRAAVNDGKAQRLKAFLWLYCQQIPKGACRPSPGMAAALHGVSRSEIYRDIGRTLDSFMLILYGVDALFCCEDDCCTVNGSAPATPGGQIDLDGLCDEVLSRRAAPALMPNGGGG